MTHEASWTQARRALHAVIGEECPFGERISTTTLERLLHERGLSHWRPLERQGEDDERILDEIIAALITDAVEPDDSAPVIVVTDESYLKTGTPFGLRWGELRAFAASFLATHADTLFGCDVLIMVGQHVVFVHHEGFFIVLASS